MIGEINKIRNNHKGLWLILFLIIAFFILCDFYILKGFDFTQYNSLDTENPSAHVIVVGDIMLDRNVRNIINRISFDKFFYGIKPLIKDADIAIANLEGPFTTNPSVTAGLISKELIFTFDPTLSTALANLGFDILGLANNHTYNFGKQGLESTRRYIGSGGMLYYGDPFNKDEISTVIIKNGIKIGFVGFHEFYYVNFDKVMGEIVRLRKDVDVLIVTPHWGVEYQKEPTSNMVQWSHEFIDKGADAVIGTHPHIIGDTEIYKDKKIYYSLGNFAFDQYFSEDTMRGLAVEINIEKHEDKIYLNYKDIKIRVDREGVRVWK